jgi:hypothetical protein
MNRVKQPDVMYKPTDILPFAIIPTKLNKQPIKQSTQNSYIFIIKRIHKYYTREDINDDDDIIKSIKGEPFDYKKIVKQLPYLFNEDYVYDIICKFSTSIKAIVGIFSRINGFRFFRKRIIPYIDVLNEYQQKKRETRTIDKDVKDKLSFTREDILSNLDKLSKNRDKILYLLFTLIPTRRAHDYRYTKIANAIPDDDIDKNFNYYYDKKIYIYNTKNKKYYECIVPDEVIPFIDTSKEFLLGDKLIGQSQISALIKTIFKKIYGDEYNATLVRRLYATHSFDNMNKNEIKHNAIAMGHSLTEHFNYSLDNTNII